MFVTAKVARVLPRVTVDPLSGAVERGRGGFTSMLTCPWCDEDATDLVLESSVDSFECPTCGTCIDIEEAPVALDVAA
jgi:hypothetical protein